MKQFKFRSITCGLLGALLLLGIAAPLTFTACENEHPEISITLTSDYSGIIEAINNANKSLADKLALIEAAVKNGNVSGGQSFDLIIEAINSLTGSLESKLAAIESAIKNQTTSLETKLSLIEAALKTGFADSKAADGLIQTALESLTGSLEEKIAAIETAIKNQTTSLETKLDLIEAALKTGFTDEKTALGEIKTALESLKGSVDGLDGAIDDVVAAINKVTLAVDGTNTALTGDIAKALDDIFKAIDGLTDYSDILEAIKTAIENLVVSPGYDFLHLIYYTFNTEHASDSFIQKYDFTGNDGSVTWWSRVNPRYRNGVSDISNRYALKEYDVSPINLTELAFNVVDENDHIMDDTDIAAAGLSAEFSTIGTTDHSSLWVSPTVFYYKSKEPFIRMRGKLFLNSDGIKTPLPTRFSKPKASVTYPEEELDYSSYALVAWLPFKEMTLAKNTYTITLDENKKYVVALADVTGLALKDNRPQGVSYDVFKDNDWITGDVTDPNAAAASGGNGYISGVSSRQAYSITPKATAELPSSLKSIMGVKYSADGVSFSNEQNSAGSLMPYFVVDYTSEVQFMGEMSIPVTITFESPWQDVSAKCTIVVRGVE